MYVGGCWFSMAMVRQADVDYGDMLMIYATQLLLITKFAVFHFKHSSVTNRGLILDVLQLALLSLTKEIIGIPQQLLNLLNHNCSRTSVTVTPLAPVT